MRCLSPDLGLTSGHWKVLGKEILRFRPPHGIPLAWQGFPGENVLVIRGTQKSEKRPIKNYA